MKNTRVLFPALLIIFLFGFGGCYTILKHPPSQDAGREYSQEYYRENCLDCHPDYHDYPYGYFYSDYPAYYFDNPRWGQYYAYPWWWEHYWYDGEYDDEDEVIAGGGTQDKVSRSRGGGMAPPYIRGANTRFQHDGGGLGGGATKPAGDSGTTAGDQTTGKKGKTTVTATKNDDSSSSSENKASVSDSTNETGKKVKTTGKAASKEKKRGR